MTDILFHSPVVAVFAREPLLGRVKTRLAVTLGEATALAVYRQLLQRTLQQVQASGIPWVLMGESPSAVMEAMASEYGGGFLLQQQGAELGYRMSAALASLQQQHDAVVLIGSDCALLTAAHLEEAFGQLQNAQAVVGPAEDGGFWLLGSQRQSLWRDPDILQGIPYGGPQACALTCQRLRHRGLMITMLAQLWDVDDERDYRRALEGEYLPPLLASEKAF
jgi:uncharacterized protein